VERDRQRHQRDPAEVEGRRKLREDDGADDGGGRRQQGDEERVGRASEPRHRQLVEDVRDDRRGDADADARPQRDRGGQRRSGRARADGRDGDQRDDHRAGETVDSADPARARDAVREHAVAGEQGGVREREGDAERLAAEADVREEVDAAGGRRHRGHVAARPDAEHGQQHRPQELDRSHGRERQAVDRDVDARVHRGEHHAERRDQPAALPVEAAQRPPRPAPEREYDGGRRDAQPGDAEHVDPREEQHGEGRPEVVEERADPEVGDRRNVESGRPAQRHGADGGGAIHACSVPRTLRFHHGRSKASRPSTL
jgi:ribonuclease E